MTSRRVAIVETAARLIQQLGYERTSVDDVIRAAGLSGKSHFYHYFRSKEALGFEVVEHQAGRVAERGMALLREPTIAPLDRFSLFLDALVAMQAREGAGGASPFGGLIGELADGHEGFRHRLDGIFAQWSGQLEALFAEVAGLDGCDPARLARFAIATIEGGMLMARVRRDVGVMREVAEDLKGYVAAQLAVTAGRR